MARASIYLPKFNAACKFVVARPFLVGGQQLEKGTEFDKASVPERRLRQLMDQRKLTQIPQDNNPIPKRTMPTEEDALAASAATGFTYVVAEDRKLKAPVVSTGLSRDKVSRAMPVTKIKGSKNVRKRK